MTTTSIEKINSILSDKVEENKKRELELFLINSPLSESQKSDLLKIISNLLDTK